MSLTRERIERAAVENQFMNGKIAAVQVIKHALVFARRFLDSSDIPVVQITT